MKHVQQFCQHVNLAAVFREAAQPGLLKTKLMLDHSGGMLTFRADVGLGYRNGYRPRLLTTQVGDIDLRIPKLPIGSFLLSILEPRRQVDQAL